MRNLRKLTAVVIAIALVLTSMTAAFAATTPANGDKAATLKDLGLYAGTDASDVTAGLDGKLTTQDSLIFLAKLFGYNEAANKLTAKEVSDALAKFDDAKDVADYAKNVVAYSAINGILSGSTKGGKFFVGPKDTVTADRFATFILKQMGYEVADFTEAAAQISEVKGSKVSAQDGDLTRDAAVGIMFGILTAEKADAKTVIAVIVGTDAAKIAIAQKAGLIAAPKDLAVESIKALNAKQLEIKFNADMDKDSAQDEANYTVKNYTLTTDSAILVDSKTVILTIDEAGVGKMTNSSNATVTVKKDIKPVSANKMAADYVNDKVAVSDGVIPSVVKAEATGEKTIKLTFSEPVYDGTDLNIPSTNFTIKSGTYTYFVSGTPVADNNAYTVTFDVGVKLIEGPVTVTVNAAGVDATDAIRDYAGYKVFKSDITFNYVKDTSVSVVSVKEAKPDYVTLKFSKPVKGQITLYHSASKVAAYGATVTQATLSDEWTFNFTNKLPQGTVKLFLVNSDSSNEPTDGYGIKVPEQTLTTEITVDTTAPKVSSTKINTNVSYALTFDEALDATEAVKTANYTFKTVADGKDVPFTPSLSTDKKTVTLTATLTDNTQYQVVVKSAKDTSGNKTTEEYSYTFTVGDNTNPTISGSYAVASEGKIYITFSEPMNETQMVDKTNYTVDKTSSGAFAALGDNDTVTKLSDKRVLIDIDGTVSNPSVRIAAITDLAGKKLGGTSLYATVNVIGAETVAIDSAKLIAKNKVKVTFTTEIAVFDNLEVSFVNSAGAAFTTPVAISGIESQTTNSDGKSEIVVVLDRDVATDATYLTSAIKIKTAATINNTKSVSGTKLVASTLSSAISDGVAPEVVTYDADTDNKGVAKVVSSLAAGTVTKNTTGTISIYFSETIKPASVSALTFTVAGYTVGDVVHFAGNVITLDITANADNTTGKPTVTQVYNITDANGNVFASGTTWISR